MKKSKKEKRFKLRNFLSKEDAQKKVATETFKRVTVSFYRYVYITDSQKMRDTLWTMWEVLGCLGRIYVSNEGINAQMSVPEHNWEQFKNELYSIQEFANVPFKIGVIQDSKSFWKLNIKVRKNIVADGLKTGDYDIENIGKHLSAAEFNQAMSDPETIVVDMRNHYESEIGHFENALCHEVNTFREQLPLVAKDIDDKKDKKLLLYCTGGIRCEKASAYFKDKGFKDVNQLLGGIISYKHQVEEQKLENKFRGSNYVFDGRDKENISGEIISHCHQCGELSDDHTNCGNKSCNLLFIQCSNCSKKMKGTCSRKCKRIALLSSVKQTAYYKKHGKMAEKVFSKSIKAKKSLQQKSPWQKVLSLFQ